ncbi:hypothetical protein P167DRAFT_221025 [Morchella conica CCBAS932]|uniref:Uncharacterized protein n=1 Tax=Morchella conica CCBAS932 TaxID=1392247 RepID=A0A3N4KPF1_9PEZI|nr:hypothetical protein P167DRAFT_221025 [Morchella conica CCBAS932]
MVQAFSTLPTRATYIPEPYFCPTISSVNNFLRVGSSVAPKVLHSSNSLVVFATGFIIQRNLVHREYCDS